MDNTNEKRWVETETSDSEAELKRLLSAMFLQAIYDLQNYNRTKGFGMDKTAIDELWYFFKKDALTVLHYIFGDTRGNKAYQELLPDIRKMELTYERHKYTLKRPGA